jgi:hypothetical protein
MIYNAFSNSMKWEVQMTLISLLNLISNTCKPYLQLRCLILASAKNNVKTRRVRVTIMTGSSLDDCIYWHFGYIFSLSHFTAAQALGFYVFISLSPGK